MLSALLAAPSTAVPCAACALAPPWRSCIHHGRYCSIYGVPEQYKGRYGGAQVRGTAEPTGVAVAAGSTPPTVATAAARCKFRALAHQRTLPPCLPPPPSPRPPAPQVVEQNKRHLCAFQVLNQTAHEPWRWWHYAAGARRRPRAAEGRPRGLPPSGPAALPPAKPVGLALCFLLCPHDPARPPSKQALPATAPWRRGALTRAVQRSS